MGYGPSVYRVLKYYGKHLVIDIIMASGGQGVG